MLMAPVGLMSAEGRKQLQKILTDTGLLK